VSPRADRLVLVCLLAIGLLAVVARAGASRTTSVHSVLAAFRCIHHYEGSWTANTGNGYYGGLQMDSSFEWRYGAEFVRAFGHANRWPPALQLAVAVRAWTSRGFGPWPNTARRCGLR